MENCFGKNTIKIYIFPGLVRIFICVHPAMCALLKGLTDYKPEFGDQHGVSAVLIHTEKGKKIFDKLQEEITSIKCEAEMISPQNPCLLTSVQPHVERTRFLN